MTILLALTLFTFVLGQLGRISFQDQVINIYVYEIFMVVTLLYLVIKQKLNYSNLKPFKFTITFFIVLTVSFLLSLTKYNLFENLVGFLYLGRIFLYFGYFILLFLYFPKAQKLKTKLHHYFILTISAIAISSTAQILLYPDLRNLYYLGWDEHLYRVFGLFFDTSAAAAVYGLIVIYLVTNFHELKKYKNWEIALLVFFSILALFTYSRGLYLSFAITVSYFFLKNKLQVKYLFILLIFLGLSIGFIYKQQSEASNFFRTASINSRIQDYTQAVTTWRNSPIFGIGYNRIRFIKKTEQYQTITIPNHAASSYHSSFLTILVSAGIVGLVAMITWLRELTTKSQNAIYYVGFLSIFSLFDNVLLHPFVLFLLFVAIILDKYNLSS